MDWIEEISKDFLVTPEMSELEAARTEGQRLMHIVARYAPVVSAARALVKELGDRGPRESQELPYASSWCAICERDDGHAPDCPWQALVAALRGDG